jgi:hypothetical protein
VSSTYIEENCVPSSEFTRLLNTGLDGVLQGDGNYNASFREVMKMQMNSMERARDGTWEILTTCAYLASNSISRHMLVLLGGVQVSSNQNISYETTSLIPWLL